MSDDLPMGWVEKSLLELTGIDGLMTDGDWIESKDQDPNGEVRLIQLADIGDGIFVNKSSRFLKLDRSKELKCTFLQEGDLLIARMPDPLGRACLFPNINQLSVTAVDVCVWRAGKEGVNSKWLMYFINSPAVRNQIQSLASGTTRQRISGGNLKKLPLPVPPLNEQRRIVDKLDRIGDRQRSARNELNHIPKLIARYKQSVLAAACTGKLTEDFRLLHSLSISTISLSEACNSITDGDHQAPPKSETGIPFITISAINDGSLSLNKATRFVPKSYFDALSKIRKPEIGDILFTVTGSIGIPVIVDTDEPFVFQRHIAILKANENLILSKYLLYTLGSEQIQKQALNVATGTAQLTIPLGGLRNFQIQLPSLEEQKEIVRRVEKMFEKIDMMEQEYQKAVKLCDRLEQATLAKAFRGELVPQDPDDEPASVLLEQVKRERSKGKIKIKK